MADERKYYVMCADNCKFEGMTKEQIYAAIAKATGKTAGDVDGAFITMLKELNAGDNFKIWVGTQAQFNAQVANIPSKTFCYITDDTTAEDINTAIVELKEAVKSIESTFNTKLQDTTKDLVEKDLDIENKLNGETLYKGGAVTSFEIPNNNDYTAYTRFVARCKLSDNTTKIITFNVIEIETATGGMTSGNYTVTAYATRYDGETHETYKLDFTVILSTTPPPEMTTAQVSILETNEAITINKLIGFKC